MAGFRINQFKGIRPHVSATKLAPGEAKTALNVKLGSGDLEPIPDKSVDQAVSAGRSTRSIYKFDNHGSPLWFEWDDVVDVIRGPVKDDSIERTYYTGDTTGNGSPKLTTTALADLGNGGPYPEDWLYIGVPAPVNTPVITPVELPEDKSPEERLATNFRSNEVTVDLVKWTVYPGVGTRNQTWRPNSAATGPIKFELNPGQQFRVLSVINSNTVTIGSVTEAGISLRTVNSDKTTVNDWAPMDEQGTSGPNQEADFIGWRVPVGMQVKVEQHGFGVGDVITVRTTNYPPELSMSATTDFYEQDWDTEQSVDDFTSYYAVEDARLSSSATSGATYWQINGSFYFDVDRAGSTANEMEDRSYVYTYVNSLGEEGPPSSPSASQPIIDGHEVVVTGMSLPPTIGYDITLMRLYRTNSTEAGTEYQFVKEFPISRTTRDQVSSIDLAEIISTTTWDPPPPTMKGITTMPNGMIVGFSGKQLYFCEPYFPHAYPAEYDQALDYDIVALASFGNSVVALTEGWPYIVTGSHPRNINVRPIKINQACVSATSVATDKDKVYYASPDGIVEIGVNGIRVATDGLMDKEDWATYVPSSIVAEFYEGKYYAFYDFDATVIDPVITAEVSGTITDADEADIVNGLRTIIITLTGETWVSAGTAFDNQRQNIIDGISDTGTPQTLGWDNVLRDTNLAVTDVVRTSDTIVTITLPVSPTYSIVTAETIQVTIPHEALIISNADLKTGSTFKIEPQLWEAVVIWDGSIDGATEAQIVSGGRTIWLTLTKDKWITLADGFNDYREQLLDGIIATTNEDGGWNDTVRQQWDASDVDRNTDTIVIISIPGIADYSITANEQLNATVPHEMLQTQEDTDVTTLSQAAIVATGELSAIFGGTLVAGGALEEELVAGGETLTITLSNDTWKAAGTGPIGSEANSQALVDAITAALPAQTLGWNNVILPGIEAYGTGVDLVRTSDTVATITLDAESTYSISDNEVISCTIPAAALTGGVAFDVSNTFAITAQQPAVTSLDGTVISTTVYEADIVAGGKTIIVDLYDDTFLAQGTGKIGSLDDTNEFIDGFNAATSPANGWNDQIAKAAGAGSLTNAQVTRNSDTKATFTLVGDAQYDISSAETITCTVPAAVLTGGVPVVASPTFQINPDVTATATMTGTATAGINEADIVAGGKTIVLTLTGDTWVGDSVLEDGGPFFIAQRQNIINSLDSGQAEAGGWDAKVKAIIGETTVVRTSDTVVTITLPPITDYDITANETITADIHADAMVLTSTSIPTSPTTFDILAQGAATIVTLGGTMTASVEEADIVAGAKVLTLTLTNDTWAEPIDAEVGSTADTQALINSITAALSPANGWNLVVLPGVEGGAEGDLIRTSDTVVTITFDAEATYAIDNFTTETITANVPAETLQVSSVDVLSANSFTVTADDPVPTTCVLSGTATVGITEADIVTGGKQMILTLSNDEWIPANGGPVGTIEQTRSLISAGYFDAAGSPAGGWNGEVRYPDGTVDYDDVIRNTDTRVVIPLPATPGYDITADETVTCNIPADLMVTSSIDVAATGSAVISFTAAVQLSTQSEAHYNPGGVCYSGYEFYADGHIAVIGPGLADRTPIDAAEWWSDQPSGGIGASYDIRYTNTISGGWDTKASNVDVWYNLTAGAIYYCRVLARGAPDTSAINTTFEIRDTGVGSALDSATFTSSASN